ncbi:MAG TPA: hypothetical protein VF756_17095, partial [Thermoanaerobaculia bacterium]
LGERQDPGLPGEPAGGPALRVEIAVMRRLGILAVAMLAAVESGGASVVEVDPGDPKCATDGAVPRCSLRAALDAANAAGGGLIRLAPRSVHSLTGVAAVNGLEGGSGLPSVTAEVTIEGSGAIVERSTAPGTPPFRIFHVAPQGRLTLRDLTVRHGLTEGYTDGGGLWNTGALVLERVTVTGNTAGDDGGGIRNDGVLRMVGSFVTANRADGEGGTGGGVYNLPVAGAGEVDISDTVLRDNRAGDRGGAIWNSGTVRLEGAILEGNSARVGGGAIRNVGSMRLTRCRIVGNLSEGRAGGVSALGPVEAWDTTVAGNSAPSDPDYEGDFKMGGVPAGRTPVSPSTNGWPATAGWSPWPSGSTAESR